MLLVLFSLLMGGLSVSQASQVFLILGGISNEHADIMQTAEAYTGHLGEDYQMCQFNVDAFKPPLLTYNSAAKFIPGMGMYICGGNKDYATNSYPACYRKETADSDWQVIELPGAINKSEDATLLTLDNPENGVLWLVGGNNEEGFMLTNTGEWAPFLSFDKNSHIVKLVAPDRLVNKYVYLANEVGSVQTKFTACYCNQDSSPCKPEEHECTDSGINVEVPGMVHSASSFFDTKTNQETALFVGYNRWSMLSLSEWIDGVPIFDIVVGDNFFRPKEPELLNLDGIVYSIGGTSDTNMSSTVLKYDAAGDTWQMLQPLETGRKYHTVVSVPDEWLCDGSPPATTEKSSTETLGPQLLLLVSALLLMMNS